MKLRLGASVRRMILRIEKLNYGQKNEATVRKMKLRLYERIEC